MISHGDREAGRTPQPFVTADFDYRHSPKPAGTYFRMYDEFRASSPVVRSTANQGWWMLTRGAAIREACQRHDLFSSTAVVVNEPDPSYVLLPEMLDPPEHTALRRVLAPLFSPLAVRQLEPRVRRRCTELIDGLTGEGSCDFVAAFARRFPTSIFMELMGLPTSESAKFMAWEDLIVRTPTNHPEYALRRLEGMQAVTAYFDDLIAARRADPRDDIVSFLVHAAVDGQSMSDAELQATCLLFFMAGLDTVATQLAWSFLHLATHPSDRQRLVTEPSIIPLATEEFLRAFAFVNLGRKVTKDVEFHGHAFEEGDMVLLPLGCATRDPSQFDRADQVVVDRQHNPHVAFGAGPHRCLGSHLARQELHVALEEWHRRIPDYRLADGVELLEHGGMVGLDLLPLLWD